MKILKKLTISIVIIMIIISSILPSSSYADFNSQQQAQMQSFITDYVANYGGSTKSTYSQGEVREYIYNYKVADKHQSSLYRTPEKDIYGTITSDCSSFVSFVYYSTCNYGMRGWTTYSFDNFKNAKKEDNRWFYNVGNLSSVSSSLQVGDIIIYRTSSEGHVMIYAGNNQIAHMSSTKDLVIVPLGQWVYDKNPYVLRITKFDGNLDTTIKDVDTSYNPSESDENGDSEYHEPAKDPEWDDGEASDNFQYYGLPRITKIEANKPWIDVKLSDIIDYLVGFAILSIKMPLIGYTEIMEMIMSTGLDAIVGVDVSDSFDSLFSFMINSSRNVTIENIIYNRVPILDVNVFDFVVNKNYTGTGASITGNEQYLENSYGIITKIKETVAIWYYAFRNLVIIIMLAVLIYVGIRMAITSVAEEKARYKSMLIAWVVSFIVVFGIHYYMIIVMQLNQEVINLIVPKDTTGIEISLYETVRSRAYELKASRAIIGTLMYMLLVWYTLKFLLIYAKRLLAIIVLILIAPFVGATFAINKIKDGKTPIFDNWMKEYTINVIIQAIHAVIYTIFVLMALRLSGLSLAGIILAFTMIKFMTSADKIVRKIFKLRSGAKYSILDNNLSAAEDLASNISGLVAGGVVANAYKNKWLKPVYGKAFNFAKNVLNIPFQTLRAGVISGTRDYLNRHQPSGKHPVREQIMNAIASSTLNHEREPILDKYGMPILGADGKPLYKEVPNWKPKGIFMMGNDGVLRYYELPHSLRETSSDIDKYIAQERAKARKNNKEAIKTLLKFGGDTIKGAALLALSIPLLIDNPIYGLNLFLRGYSAISPAYINRRKIKIKGYRKTIKTKKMTFKEFGQGLKDKMRYNLAHPIKTAGGVIGFVTGANIYVKPIMNGKDIIAELGNQQERSARQIQLLYEIRETEADAVEHAKIMVDAIKRVRASSPALATVADDVQAELDVALLEYAKAVYGEEFYDALKKNVKVNVNSFRTKLQIQKFMQEYARSNHATEMDAFDRKLQTVIRTENPKNAKSKEYNELISKINGKSAIVRKIKVSANPDKSIKFEAEFERKLNELQAQGKTTVNERDLIDITNDIIRENEIKNSLRSLNPKLSTGKTSSQKFEADIADSDKLKEELRNIYGDKLGSKFEYQMDILIEAKKKSGTSTITEKEMKDVINELIINEKTLNDAQFTENDINGMKAQIDKFMKNNGSDITFDDELEQRIKDEINSSSKTNSRRQKVVSGNELKDILYELIEENKPDENAILTKEEVIDLVDMIKEKNTEKDVEFGKEFEENINKVMQEEIVRRTIDEHIKANPTKKTDKKTLSKLEREINKELEKNGYDTKVDDILQEKDITSSLEDSLKENLEKQIDEIDTKSKNTEVKELTDMIMDAARQKDSIHRELMYNGKPLDYSLANEFARDVEKLRALNHKAEKIGLKRNERNGKKLKVSEPVTDISDLVKNIWDSAKKS